jgi:biotin carboxyl carrier protein
VTDGRPWGHGVGRVPGCDGPAAPVTAQPDERPVRLSVDRTAGRSEDPIVVVVPDGIPPGAVVGAVGPLDPAGRRVIEVVVDGWRFELVAEDAARAELRGRATSDPAGATTGGGPLEIRAIIPGRVLAVAVVPGDAVAAGDALLVVEAMKMQNELRAPRTGAVARVLVGAGSTVEVGDVLVVLE